MKKILYTVAALALVTACKPKVDEFEASAGTANFGTYVAVGNSLTAGYSNGALYRSGQEYSYPNILAKQFEKVGGGTFAQPYMIDDDGIGVVTIAPGTNKFFKKRSLAMVTGYCDNVTALSPVTSEIVNPVPYFTPITAAKYNNMGVPGAKSFHLSNTGFGHPTFGNPFYTRFASSPGTSSVIADVMVQKPTFFTLWIGSNDVLLYAVGGGEEAKNINPSDTLTPPAIFNFYLKDVVDSLSKNGTKGAIANIPDITAIPYFTTVPYNALVLDQAKADQLNAAYAAAFGGAATAQAPGFTFTVGANAFVIADATKPGGIRRIKSTEYILLSVPQDSLKCAAPKPWGSAKGIPANYVLDESEIAKVISHTNQYNQTIESLAATKGLAFVNTNALLASLKSGFSFDGVDFTNKYVTGGAFSLDGIHLTPRGYAVTANHFIKAINFQYKATIPLVNVSEYPGLNFPN